MFERQCQYSSLFGRLEADNTKFVSYNNQAPPPSRLPDVTHVTLSPRSRPSPCFYILQVIKNWRREWPGNEANQPPFLCTLASYPAGKDVWLKTQACGFSCIQSIVDCKQTTVDSTLRARQIDYNTLKARVQGCQTFTHCCNTQQHSRQRPGLHR